MKNGRGVRRIVARGGFLAVPRASEPAGNVNKCIDLLLLTYLRGALGNSRPPSCLSAIYLMLVFVCDIYLVILGILGVK